MNSKIKTQKEKEVLRSFDKELFSHTGKLSWFNSGLFSFLLLILLALPIQEISKEDRVCIYSGIILSCWLTFYILLPYINITDSLERIQPNSSTYTKLKYLPISKKQYILVRMGYLFRFFRNLMILGMIVQCTTALISKCFGIENVLYIIGMLFVLPMLVGWLDLTFNTIDT